MTEELDHLVREYRAVRAPAALATRVRAEVRDQHAPRFGWLPVASTAVLAAALVGVLPLLWHSSSLPPEAAPRPSLSTLAALKVDKPASVSPSLTQLKTVKAPRMPARPKPIPPEEQTNTELEYFKEKDHAHS